MALILSLIGNILVNYKKKVGFIVWCISNIAWIMVNFLSEPNYPQIIMYVVYMGLNINGFWLWYKSDKQDRSDKK